MKSKILTLFLCLLSTMAFAEPKKEFQALYGSHGTYCVMEAEESLQQPAAAVTEPRIETALDVSPQPHRARVRTVLLTVIPADVFVGLLRLLEHPRHSEMEVDVLLALHQLQPTAPLTGMALEGLSAHHPVQELRLHFGMAPDGLPGLELWGNNRCLHWRQWFFRAARKRTASWPFSRASVRRRNAAMFGHRK